MTARIPLLTAGALVLAAAALFAGATTEEGSSQTAATPAGKYQEAPMLAALVAAGELPR